MLIDTEIFAYLRARNVGMDNRVEYIEKREPFIAVPAGKYR